MTHLLIFVIYLAFISLGLPDSVLGSAWPSMYNKLHVPISYAGILSMLIAIGTVVSSLSSDFITKKLNPGKVTALSVAMTAAALFGFSVSENFYVLCLWSIPYGLGAGSVDAALNNYVAKHYTSRHMSWLHCMWGVGTIIGPNIMGYVLTQGGSWQNGYASISFLQIALTIILVFSLPLWKMQSIPQTTTLAEKTEPSFQSSNQLSLFQKFKIPGVKEVAITFFCYSAVEQTAMLWAGSYMVLHHAMSPEDAAKAASILFIGITAGRFLNGFLTIRFTDTQMIRAGQILLVFSILLIFISPNSTFSLVGFAFTGLGLAPIYPSVIHSTPGRFGMVQSQAIIGIQMATAYIGTSVMPPVFGIIADATTISVLPIYLLVFLALMIFFHERLVKMTSAE